MTNIALVLWALGAIAYLTIGDMIGKWYAAEVERTASENRLGPDVIGVENAREWEKSRRRTILAARVIMPIVWLPLSPFIAIEGLMGCPMLRMMF